MDNSAWELAKRLSKIQVTLRRQLTKELESEEDLESAFDPYSYSPLVNELRDKYLTHLAVIQALIQQLVVQGQGKKKPSTKVVSVSAQDREDLVRLVNAKLEELNGARVLDVKFVPSTEDDEWTSIITYVANPLMEQPDGSAAWM